MPFEGLKPARLQLARWRWLAAAIMAAGMAWAAGFALRTDVAYLAGKHAAAAGDDATAVRYLRTAVAERPDAPQAWLQLADRLQSLAPDEARASAQRAVDLDRNRADAWEKLGLLDFELGASARADTDLRRAVAVSHGFQSHFELGNLELLLGNLPEFERQMQEAIALGPLEMSTQVLRQGLAAGLQPEQMAGWVVPTRPDAAAEVIAFFLRRGDLAASWAAWRRMRCSYQQEEFCASASRQLMNRLLDAAFQQPPAAGPAQAWARQALELGGQAPAGAGAPVALEFDEEWPGPGFAWGDRDASDVMVERDLGSDEPLVRISLDGSEPDRLSLFRQYRVLRAGQYLLRFRCRTLGRGADRGIGLEVRDGPGSILLSMPVASSSVWTQEQGEFRIAGQLQVVEIAATYARPAGAVPMATTLQCGTFALGAVTP